MIVARQDGYREFCGWESAPLATCLGIQTAAHRRLTKCPLLAPSRVPGDLTKEAIWHVEFLYERLPVVEIQHL